MYSASSRCSAGSRATSGGAASVLLFERMLTSLSKMSDKSQVLENFSAAWLKVEILSSVETGGIGEKLLWLASH